MDLPSSGLPSGVNSNGFPSGALEGVVTNHPPFAMGNDYHQLPVLTGNYQGPPLTMIESTTFKKY